MIRSIIVLEYSHFVLGRWYVDSVHYKGYVLIGKFPCGSVTEVESIDVDLPTEGFQAVVC